MNVFRYGDYREVIQEKVKASKKEGHEVHFSKLAADTRIQRAYISRVLKKEAHFNADQLYLTSRFLKFTKEETDYLLLLLDSQRSVVSERKKELQKQIKEIQMRHRDTRKHLKAEAVHPLAAEDYQKYFLDPYAPLVHVFLSLPYYAQNPEQIALRTHISETHFKATLSTLQDLRLIQWEVGTKSYRLIKDHLQLVADSPLNIPYQLFQRTHAIQKLQSHTTEERFVFSVTFSANEKTKNDIHEEFLKFLRKTEALVRETTPTEVFQMNFDLFGW